MKYLLQCWLFVLLLPGGMKLSAQVLSQDTTTNQPFFKAKKFNSRCYVGIEGMVTQMLKTTAAMNTDFSLNWVINHKYVVSAKYYVLTSPVNIQKEVAPDNPTAVIPLKHQSACLGFSYIFFNDKTFSFQPELSAGWGMIGYETYRKDFGEIIPAVYGVYNATKYFRLGVGLNYRITAGASLNGLKDADISGISGVVFMRVGTF